MSALLDQQRALQAAICAGDEGAADDGASVVRARPAAGLDVYRHAYVARLTAALRDNFTVLHRALGDDEFDALAAAYVDAHPSRTPSIRWFGDRLADFMTGAYAERLPHESLADFARMDWALRGAFDAAAAPPLRPATLMALAPEQWPTLRLALQASVAQIELGWAIEPAWRALREWDPESGDEQPELAAPEPLTHRLLVWRDASTLDTRWRSLEPLEAALLDAVAAGASFEALCNAVAVGAEADAAGAVVAHLQRWLADGLLSDGLPSGAGEC